MSYQVLARKYRPTNFKEVVGQDHVVQALSNSISQDRIHQAYLLAGTRGVGKTTIARILAKCLNCQSADGPVTNPCDKCSACEEIKAGRHLEFLEIDAASRTGVDDMRELIENVQYKPSNGLYKIYLIDEVHMLSKASFNALLKTLEEPPEHVVFIFATTDPDRIPKTVLSRCL
jgi:DNA polymerase-3 subunit gamma/tau